VVRLYICTQLGLIDDDGPLKLRGVVILSLLDNEESSMDLPSYHLHARK
jgi:hypothetical protein